MLSEFAMLNELGMLSKFTILSECVIFKVMPSLAEVNRKTIQ